MGRRYARRASVVTIVVAQALLPSGSPRAAHEDLPAACRIARTCCARTDRQSTHCRHLRRKPGPRLVDHAFRLDGILHKRCRNQVRSRRHRNASLEAIVQRAVNVATLNLIRPADREPRDPAAVETNIQLALLGHADNRRGVLPSLQTNLDDVLGVQRKVMADSDSAARSDRQVAALAFVLYPGGRNVELRRRRRERRISDRQPADMQPRKGISRAAAVTPSEHPRYCRSRILNRLLAKATRRQSPTRSGRGWRLAYWKRLRR